MKTHSACPEVELLEHFADGRISDTEALQLEEHLVGCSCCIARLPSLGEGDGLMQALRAQMNKPRPESAVINRLRDRVLGLQTLPPSAVFPDTGSVGLVGTPSPDNPSGSDEDARSLLAPAQARDEIGRLGPYRVLRVVSAGGMGIVFEGEDLRLKRRIALKVVRPALVASSAVRQRFLREAQCMASLTHDHILAIHHVGEERTVPFLAMPLLQGESLEDRLLREGKLPVAEVLRIGRETALGLAAAHERGVIHRDIKPANLWLEAPSGRVKILDFGLARLAEGDAALSGSRVLVGTPSYMAPEQAEGEVDPRADLFSLGCVLYRMVTGQLAFPGKTAGAVLHAVANLTPPSTRQIDPETPEPLSQLIERLLSKDRARRPASAVAVAQELEEIGRTAAVMEPGDGAASLAQRASDERLIERCPPSTTAPSMLSGATTSDFPGRRKRWLWSSAAGLTALAVGFSRLKVTMTCSVALGACALAVLGLAVVLYSQHVPVELQNIEIGQDIEVKQGEVRVLSLEVKHFATVNGKLDPRSRLLGKDSFVTHYDDSVEVETRLSQPAYAFLIAFRADGTEAVCFPEKDDEPPPRTDRPRYPSVSTEFNYALNEDVGLQAFAVVVSSQPLPSFKQWWSGQGCPWQKSAAPPEVVWRAYNNLEVERLTANPAGTRGPREVLGKASVARLTDWLAKRPQVEAVAVLGFAVMPKDKP